MHVDGPTSGLLPLDAFVNQARRRAAKRIAELEKAIQRYGQDEGQAELDLHHRDDSGHCRGPGAGRRRGFWLC